MRQSNYFVGQSNYFVECCGLVRQEEECSLRRIEQNIVAGKPETKYQLTQNEVNKALN